jgi:hypothetical protein
MCRSIQKLRLPEGSASDEQIQAAALQYIRKVSGYRKPSRRNEAVFEQAVIEIARVTRDLLKGLEVSQPGVMKDTKVNGE